MTAHHKVAEAYKQFALICLGHLADADGPAARAWWTSAAQGWQDPAEQAECRPRCNSSEPFSRRKVLRLWIDPRVAGIRALGESTRIDQDFPRLGSRSKIL